ncbi:hypothetical protein BJ165DRAFT_1513693 [Panaeolus papilionaceus]|nr:hypothetical protein BJ165DRAFT_1513693 [Panaeolus papilionaceus]
MSTYTNLRITGPISLWKGFNEPKKWNVKVIVLLGQTGTGKSSFIEALSGGHALGISGDSLEAVTQEVACYKVVNVEYTYGGPIHPDPMYIIDCPGFGDDTLSVYRVIRMLQDFIQTTIPATQSTINTMLYFHRISDKRMAGSQKKTLELVKSLVGRHGGSTWTGVVTTMWDTLWRPEQLRDAEEKFDQLKSEHLKDAFGPPADMPFKFENTQESALCILDNAFMVNISFRDPPLRVYRAKSIRTGPFAIPVYQDLMDRISALQQRIRAFDSDIEEQEEEADAELLSRLLQDKAEAEKLLMSLEKDQRDFGLPPDLPVKNPSIAQRCVTFYREHTWS